MVALWLICALTLIAAAVLKAADPQPAALATYGVPARARAAVLVGVIVLEAGLAASIAAGSILATQIAGALLALFLIAQLAVIAQGGVGSPCGCFGSTSKVSHRSASRTALLAIACALAPALAPGPAIALALTTAVTIAALVLAAAICRVSQPRQRESFL